MRHRYYKRDGTPYDDSDAVLQWAKDFEDMNNHRVKLDRLWWGGTLSTVWLGLDHSWSLDPNSLPLIFETMLFCPKVRIGSWEFTLFSYFDNICQRYSTEADAVQGHELLRKNLSNPWNLLNPRKIDL